MEQYGEEKNRASWAMSLAIVKMHIKQPKRTHEVQVNGTTKSGKPFSYTYKYADLADVDKAIIDAVRATTQDDKPLLTYYFDIDNGAEGVSAETIIIDAKTGFQIRMGRVWFKNYNVGDAQKTASLISYAKRYSLSAAFGIASEDDDDAHNFTPAAKPCDVNDVGLQAIWDAYINDHNSKAKQWISGKHDPETARKIHQLLGEYKEQQEEKKKDEEVKNLVDGKQDKQKPDPYADKQENQSMTDEQQDLFNDILGD